MTTILAVAVICLISPTGNDILVTAEGMEVQISEIVPDNGSIQWTLTGSVKILDEDMCYRYGKLDCPSYIFIESENFSTFALVWFPGNWMDMSYGEKEAIVMLPHRHEQASRYFSKWQRFAIGSNRAVIAPQIWLDYHEVPNGYIPDSEGGYNLDITRDVFPLINTLTDYYGISSIQVHGATHILASR